MSFFRPSLLSALRTNKHLFFPTTQVRNAATLRDIKNRMKTVTTIKKITSSMKSVAASKLKQAERRKDMVQPFARASKGLLSAVPKPEKQDNSLFLAVTSDRGLCGSANSSIVRKTEKTIKSSPIKNLQIYCIGDKGRSGLMRQFKPSITLVTTDLDKKPLAFADVMVLADRIVHTDFDKLTVVCNKFINSLTFETQEIVLPSRQFVAKNAGAIFKGYDIEDDALLNDLYSYYLATLIYTAVIENIACELSARMSSMDNATRNAGEMLGKLTLDYNRKRQASITSELTEIISGASSVESQIEF